MNFTNWIRVSFQAILEFQTASAMHVHREICIQTMISSWSCLVVADDDDYWLHDQSLLTQKQVFTFYNGWFNDHDSSSMSIVNILQDVSENYGYLDDKHGWQKNNFSTDCLIRSKPIIFTTFHFPITNFPTSCCAVQQATSRYRWAG